MTESSMFSMVKRFSYALSATSRTIDRLVAGVCVFIIYIILMLLMTQVIMRYFLGSPPSWTEELAIMLFTWIVLLFASVGIKNNFHVALDTIPDRMKKLKLCSDILVSLLIAGFSLVMIYAGYSYLEETLSQKTAALQIPIAFLYASVPISGSIIFFHCISRLFNFIASPKLNKVSTVQDLDK